MSWIGKLLKSVLTTALLVGFLATGVFLAVAVVAPGVIVVDTSAGGPESIEIQERPPETVTADRTTVDRGDSTGQDPTGSTDSTPASERREPTATTPMSASGPTGDLEQHRIDVSRYTWDQWRDPDDPGASTADTKRGRIDSELVEYHVFVKTNEIRRQRGLDPYEYSRYLSSLSRAHTEDMHDRDYFAHRNPDGEQLWHRFRIEDWHRACEGLQENLAQNWAGQSVERPDGDGSATYWTEAELAEALVQQWMHSPSHRKALLRPENDVLGVGVYVAESSRTDGAVVYAAQAMCDYPDRNGQWGNPGDAPG